MASSWVSLGHPFYGRLKFCIYRPPVSSANPELRLQLPCLFPVDRITHLKLRGRYAFLFNLPHIHSHLHAIQVLCSLIRHQSHPASPALAPESKVPVTAKQHDDREISPTSYRHLAVWDTKLQEGSSRMCPPVALQGGDEEANGALGGSGCAWLWVIIYWQGYVKDMRKYVCGHSPLCRCH